MTSFHMLGFIIFKILKGLSHKLSHLFFQKHYWGGVGVNPLFRWGNWWAERFASGLWFFQSLAELRIESLDYSVLQFISLSMNWCWISFTLEFFLVFFLKAFRKYTIFVGNEVIQCSSPKWYYSLWNVDDPIFIMLSLKTWRTKTGKLDGPERILNCSQYSDRK